MRTVGIIAEYNPFHNGHLYHLEQAKRLSAADCAVCVMSGNFIQRGEPALVNKWARAKMALLAGVDLVLELPVVYAMSSAEFFAFAGVKILDSLATVDYLCFGSESGSIDELDAIADVLVREPDAYKASLKKALDTGLSYPSARQQALTGFLDSNRADSSRIRDILTQSNNILGIEYLKALKRLGSRITPITIQRIANSYRSEEVTGQISSATSIRKYILGASGKGPDVTGQGSSGYIPGETLPASSAAILEEEFCEGRGPVFPGSFEKTLIAIIRSMTIEEIASLPYVSEGLENRIQEAAFTSGTLEEMTDKICTRRYPRTRIQRILFSILAGFSAQDLDLFNKNGGPQYIRVLGFNDKGRRLLSAIRKKATLPVIIKAANFKKSENPLVSRMIEIEARSTDMYVLGYANPLFRKSGQEFTSNVIRMPG